MMLWDHLDLVPMYEAWQQGRLAPSTLLNIHGGHLHAAAYAILLLTTRVTSGQTWLDVCTSWLLLLGYAGFIYRFTRRSFDSDTPSNRTVSLLIVLLALYPGHLANLQWGWQVAVFLCLAGVAAAIFCLTRPALGWLDAAGAVAAAAVALLSFATAIALIPTALILIALREDLTPRRRAVNALPWIAAGLLAASWFARPPSAGTSPRVFDLAVYVLNFLGAGIARFANDLAPWAAAFALVCAPWLFVRGRMQAGVSSWLGVLLFALFAALLTALGRSAAYGSDQAFVTRYVSFSSLFWIGWIGLAACACADIKRSGAALRIAFALLAILVVANALHLIHKAREVSARTQTIARAVRDSYPEVDRGLLGEIYFDQPDVALQRLKALRDLGFAPFDRASGEPVR